MDLNVKMDDDDHHHHSLHDDLGPVIPPEEMPPHPDSDSPIGLEHDESTRKRLAYDEFPDDDDEESNKRRRKSAPPQKKLNDDQWAEMFTRLIQYKEQHGDCLVPKRYQEDPKLGTWVETQRVQYKKLHQQHGENITPNNRLNADRLQKLESAGFAWSAKNIRKPKPPVVSMTPMKKKPVTDHVSRAQARQRIHDQTWTEMYERLAAYKAKYGDCLVPKKYEEDPKLASWIENQRVLYNRDYKSHEPRSSLFKQDSSYSGIAYPSPSEGKTPEEWGLEMDKGTPATEEDAAEVAATMAEATMEVVNDVVAPIDDATMDEMGAVDEPTSDTDVAMDSPNGDGTEPMSENMLQQVRRLSQERKEKLDALGFVWSLRSKRVDDHWDLMFNQLKEYKIKHGDCLVPSRYEENFKLGKWVETQRYEYTKLQRASTPSGDGDESKPGANPRLTAERRHRLEAIGFEWKVKHKMKKYYDRQWDTMFEKLLQFKKENGHCLVPKRYPPDAKLGTWVHTQRIQFRKLSAGNDKKDTASDGEDDALEAQMKADEQLAQDEADMKDAVESLVGSDHGENRALEFAERQAAEDQFFRLTEERRRRLDDVGFVWSARDSEKAAEPSRITRNSYDEQWDSMFIRLKEYKEKHGDCLVPKRCKEDQKLGTWVDTQRVQYKKMRKKLGKNGMSYMQSESAESQADELDGSARKPLVGRLTDDRIRRLESIGFVWSLRDDWQKHYEELLEYKQEHGNCNVPARYTKNRRLGIWVSAQRQQYKQITTAVDGDKPRRAAPLTQERIDLLNEMGFTWTIRSRDSLGESWNQRLDELKQYKEQFGTCQVPSRYLPNPELGIWVGTQRTQYRLYQQAKLSGNSIPNTTSMNEDRVRQLEELGFTWTLRTEKETTWKKRLNELAFFRSTHGHCAVPRSYKGNPRLGEWAATVREAYQHRHDTGLLDEEKIAELNALGFNWCEPSEDLADATNDEVTIIVSGEDHDDALEASDTEGAIFDDNPLDSVPPLPHDDIPTGLDEGHSGSLIHEASEHAEI